MKTFNYESNCVKYKNCFFDVGKYENGKISLAIYGNIERSKETSHISNVTVNVEEKLEKNQAVSWFSKLCRRTIWRNGCLNEGRIKYYE